MRRFFCFAFVLSASLWVHALDREAFTFTKYELTLRVEPEQQRLGVRGRITLRNDSGSAQRNLSLQISSSLHWSSIEFGKQPVEFLTQSYTSDIDHTGALSEAIVVLPRAVEPKQSIDLDIGYEGVIQQDATRLTRIGAPAEIAKHAEWDQIGRSFTAVRGIGYVAWYPIATEAASLSEGDSVEETVGRWKKKHVDSTMWLSFESTSSAPILFSGTENPAAAGSEDRTNNIHAFRMVSPITSVPTFAIADYADIDKGEAHFVLQYLPGQEQAAKEYAEVGAESGQDFSMIHKPATLHILSLPDQDAAPFVTQDLLLTPLKLPMNNDSLLNLVYAKVRNSVPSPQAWIQEGLGRYAQAAFIESLQNRQAAVDYMRRRGSALVDSEKQATASEQVNGPDSREARSLINSGDGQYLQTKAMYVWWMLRDMVGENAFKETIANYRAGDDKSPTYMQKVIVEAQSHRDLQWFFDDWVYHDRGLPDFRITSVYSSALPSGGQMNTVTVENLGGAGAEVPVTLHLQAGEATQRLMVAGHSKASVRIQTISVPLDAVVNDGSVPESDMSNNEYKVSH